MAVGDVFVVIVIERRGADVFVQLPFNVPVSSFVVRLFGC
jgi:hypothetical protein